MSGKQRSIPAPPTVSRRPSCLTWRWTWFRQNPGAHASCIKIIPSTKRMVYQPTGSIYQVLSSEVATKHGLNVSACIFDELHTQPTRALYDVMTQGSGDARKQPLWFFLTTAGTDRNSICWEVHQKALDILEGRKHDPRFYPVIYRTSGRRGLAGREELVQGQPVAGAHHHHRQGARRLPQGAGNTRRTRTCSASCA